MIFHYVCAVLLHTIYVLIEQVIISLTLLVGDAFFFKRKASPMFLLIFPANSVVDNPVDNPVDKFLFKSAIKEYFI